MTQAALYPPAGNVKEAIFRGVQTAVDTIDADDMGKCANFAIVGAQVLTQIFQQQYLPVSGGTVLDCGDGAAIYLNPSRSDKRNAKHLHELHNYHCWIEFVAHNPTTQQPEREIVDFTTHNDPRVARAHGVPFVRTDAVQFVWDFYSVVEQKFHPNILRATWYKSFAWQDLRCTFLMRKHEAENARAYAHLTNLAIQDIAMRLDALERKTATVSLMESVSCT